MLLLRELDERLGFGELIERHLTDGRAKEHAVTTDRPHAKRTHPGATGGHRGPNWAKTLPREAGWSICGAGKTEIPARCEFEWTKIAWVNRRVKLIQSARCSSRSRIGCEGR